MTLARLWPFAAVVLYLVALFGPALAGGLLLAPGDGLAQYFPQRIIAAAAYQAGEMPFWNPYVFSGMPLLAALQVGALYPGNLPFLMLPPAAAMNLTVVLAYALAGWGALVFGRSIGLPRPAALLTALIFMSGGFMIAHLEHLVFVQAAGLLPWLLAAIERHRTTLDSRMAAAGAAVLTLMLLVGHPQIVVLALLVAGPYALWRSLSLETGRSRFLVAQLGALVLGAGLASALLLPGWELFRGADRQAIPYTMLVDHSLPPRQLLTLLFPFAFGAPSSALYPTPYWGPGPWRNELIGYCSLAALVLSLAALTGWRRDPRVRFFAALAVLALLLALGGLTPLYQLWAHVPVLKAMRVPARHLLELQLAVAVLAGLGFARLIEGSPRSSGLAWGAWGLALLGGLLAVWRFGPIIASRWQPFMPEGVELALALSPTQAAFWLPVALWLSLGLALAMPVFARPWAVLTVVTVDLLLFGAHVGWRQQSPRADLVAGAPGPAVPAAMRTLSLAADAYPYFQPEAARALGYPVLGALWAVRAIGGYDPFLPARYGELVGGMTHGGVMTDAEFWRPEHHALDLLAGQTLVVAPALLDDPVWRSRLDDGRFVRLAGDDMAIRYSNPRALPAAWRPRSARMAPADAVAASVKGLAPFAPLTEALIERPLATTSLTPGVADARRISLNRIALTTQGSGPGLLVVSEGYDPGWTATSAGKPLPVHRVDGLVIGIEVPAGAHEIELRYEPPLWRWGLAASGLSLAGLLGWLLVASRRYRRRG